jgi:hypothetical protein
MELAKTLTDLVAEDSRPTPRPPARQPTRVLLLAPDVPAARVAAQLRSDLEAEVALASLPGEAKAALRAETFDVLLVEEALILAQPELADSLWRLSGDTLLLEINFGITSPVRIAAHVRAALRRRAAALERAQAVALNTLRGELSESLTGLLLHTELALRGAGPELTPALRSVLALVEALARQLRL